MDYFTIKQTYYAGQYTETLKEIEKVTDQDDETIVFYKSKSQLSLNNYTKNQSSTSLGKIFDLYAEFLKSRNIKKLQSQVILEKATSFELNLLATAQAILGQYDESLETCTEGINKSEEAGSSEMILLAVQVALLIEKPSLAKSIFETYANNNEDLSGDAEQIINQAESYLKYSTSEDVAGSNFYYYEEMAQTFPSWKTQLALLNSHLQQLNIEEAGEIADLLDSDFYSVEQKEVGAAYKEHFLAAKINLSHIVGETDSDALRDELRKVNPHHPLIAANKQMNDKFDEIIAKYSS
ncbi:hypothetical protein NCAS_0A13690 [Naumovozyma castellii]|uniref:Coatomer subunit epsilon n=1 Tax=Naumovozyma castellii TaxID=27288 RepID=G0V8X8_NAUCA|nr:hypothetical protein NCAS_0A13690 [Naumovozyma castellii CBS 4309]CCC67927.1 hypothetical protein NCAS_0A13690 [Naumovozyma castellii CBS 4309]